MSRPHHTAEPPGCAYCGESLAGMRRGAMYCSPRCREHFYRHGAGEPVTLEEVLAADAWAVAAARQAADLLLTGREDEAYVAVRLAAPAIIARHSLGMDPQTLAFEMLRTASVAAMILLPVPVDGRRMI